MTDLSPDESPEVQAMVRDLTLPAIRDSGRRAAPMSLRSGPKREPVPLTVWQLRHAPFPSKIAFPRVASPITVVDATNFALARI